MISSTSKAFLSTMVRPCRLRAPSHTRISTVKQQARSQQPLLGMPAHRQFSQTLSFALPRKDSQDKDSINTEATEYSKSATDDEGAKQEEAAFNPDITDPQQEKDKAGEGTGEGTVSKSSLHLRPDHPKAFESSWILYSLYMFPRSSTNAASLQDTNNPLDVSPANPEVSKQRGETEGGAENSSSSSNTESERERSSGGSSPSKGRKVA